VSVADSISGALQRFGRTMTLRRISKGPASVTINLDVEVKGTAKNYRTGELISQISEVDAEVTIANADIAAAQWPGPPKSGDKFIVDGKTKNIESVEPKYLGSEILVFVCRVRG
jgi:hypothetical protein